MKPSLAILAVLAVLALASGSTAAGSSENNQPTMVRVDQVRRAGVTVVTPGTTEAAVWDRLGLPDRRLADNVWVYKHYHGTSAGTAGRDCRTLLVIFEDARVASIALLNPRASQVVARNLKKDPDYLSRALYASK